MQYGIILTTGDPRTAADLGVAAEAAGWDGVFTWDAISIGETDGWDPWILLAAVAARTERVRLGAMVFAPSRRRPWKVARELLTLDHLSGGRLVFPVGLGALDDAGFGNVGEPTDARTRAELLDETLAIIDGLSTGRPFGFDGDHYRFGPMTFRPTPVQRPRVPVWVVGSWPHERSMRRAIRWDGVVIQGLGGDGQPSNVPADLAEVTAWIAARRLSDGLTTPFDIVVSDTTPADDPAAAAATTSALAAAGATWWIEGDWADTTLESLRRRIAAGPPRG
jgi:alkanesulfonate monooxygenase SsuD/methylene tetrahydromethanopterin reductase-like flavin-dependent oxidoreductase (luciferase family)